MTKRPNAISRCFKRSSSTVHLPLGGQLGGWRAHAYFSSVSVTLVSTKDGVELRTFERSSKRVASLSTAVNHAAAAEQQASILKLGKKHSDCSLAALSTLACATHSSHSAAASEQQPCRRAKP